MYSKQNIPRAGKVTIVTGPVGSGKSRHVDNHAGPDDVIVDFDRLAAAAGSVVDHRIEPHRPQHLSAALTAWVALVRWVENRAEARDVNCWIIHATPKPSLLEHYRRMGTVLEMGDQ